MAYKVIIAEKPSVAKGIAKIVGATEAHTDKANGYLEGNGYKVTWAFGHLVGLQSPEDMGFDGGVLPILPEEWKTQVLKGADAGMSATVAKQVKTIESLFKGADEIIVATDAGREGELIFRYIYEYLGCRTPFRRLWISSLTDEAIRDGMASLKPGRDYDALSDAAHARSEADWLLGYNASRALRLATGYRGNLSLGRVQTPVLCMICDCYDENKNFVPVPYWQVGATMSKSNSSAFDVLSVKKYDKEDEATAATGLVRSSGKALVTKVEKKEVKTAPPLLYDLTALQRAANSKLGLTADDTLKIAQSLYEKKYLSYPRTGSRYIGDDVFKTIPGLIRRIGGYGRFADAAAALSGKKLCAKSVDASKVTDHHALLPTDNIPSGLTGNEKSIWEMVAGRALEAFGEWSIADRTTVELDSAGVLFKATGSVVKYPGWKAVFGVAEADGEGKKDDDETDAGVLPEMREGETLDVPKAETVRKTTKPLPIYTDSSLLGEMETCGKRIEDEELRESMKDIGLGTPATRAATIEILIRRGYVSREGKKLVPTPLGTEIWKTVRGRRIADVRTSGEWERDLAQVEHGKIRKSSFDEGIKAFALEVIDDLRKNCRPLGDVSVSNEPPRICPCCGKPMKNMKFSITCDQEAGGCGLKISREVAGKKLPESAIAALAAGKTTAEIKGFKSKSGKVFAARLAVNKETRKVDFVFPEKPAATMAGRVCPLCGGAVEDKGALLECGCGLKIWKTVAGARLSDEQIDAVLAGKTVAVAGMKSKSGKPFKGGVRLNKGKKGTELVFDNKK